MKKIIAAGALSLLLLTGCGKQEKIECTMSKKTMGIQMDTSLTVELDSNKFRNLDMTINSTLPESLASVKQTYIDKLKEQYASFKNSYGVEPKVSETEDGVKIEMNMNAKQAEEYYGSNGKISKKDVIEEFEKQGFECK